MEMDFFDELPTVFNILKFNPGAVVDDTAIERLLSWLEEMCTKKKKKLVEKSLSFFEAEEIWMHSMTLSFALRFAGFVGYHYSASEDGMVDVIKKMLLKVKNHKQFSEATVEYGFYKCLNSLSKDISWYEFLKDFLSTTLETFKSSYIFVQKAAVQFFASLMCTLLKDESERLLEVLKTIESISEPQQLYQIVESILLVSESNLDLFLKFLSTDKLIKQLILSIRSCQDHNACVLLFKSLTSLFSVLTKPESEVDWYVTISEENPEEFLLEFVRFVKVRSELKMFVPSFCRSLMLSQTNDSVFSPQWNYKLLQFALSDIAYHDNLQLESEFLHYHKSVPNAKTWKNILITILGEMISIESKIFADPLCLKLLTSWKHYCLMILTVSLSNDSEKQMIDDNLITVMYDKKVPRLCFRYLKDAGFKVLDKELNKKFSDCLWNCLFCITDNPQIVCGTLELLTRYISKSDDNLAELIQYSDTRIYQSIHNTKYSLADILNKLLWDTNWEVQDSLIDVLLMVLEKAKSGSHVCQNFLRENTFWVKVIDLINNQESYIRSKTVAFLGEIALYKPTWEVFCIKGSHTFLDIFKLLEKMFTCEERQDDMFTRRSILQIIRSWVLSKLEYLPILVLQPKTINGHATEMDEIKICLLKMLENGSRDFDWEVRKLTFSLWKDMAVIVSERAETDEKELFIDYVSDNDFALVLCNGIIDCEYLVKMEAFKCLTFIKDNFFSVFEDIDGSTVVKQILNEMDTCKKIQTVTEYEDVLQTLKTMDRKRFLDFLSGVYLEEIGNQLDILDVKVTTDPVSFIRDVIASSKQSEANLLDCY